MLRLQTTTQSSAAGQLPYRRVMVGLLAATLPGGVALAQDASPPPSSALPDHCILALEVADPPALARAATDAMMPLVAELPDELRGLLALGTLGLTATLGVEPEDLVATLLPGPAVMGVFLEGRRPVAVLCSRIPRPRAAAAKDLLARLGDRIPHAFHGDLLVLSGATAGLSAVERQLADGRGSWTERLAPLAARAVAQNEVAWARVDLRALRSLQRRTGTLPPALRTTLDGGGTFLFGAVAQVLDDADELTATLATDRGLRLCVRVDGSIRDTELAGLWPGNGGSRALPAPPPGTAALLTLDRSLRTLLREPERFLKDEHAVQARAFLTIADQLTGNASFTEDLLGGLREPIHLYVLDIAPPAEPQPGVQLPTFALVAETANDDVEAVLRRTMTALVFITNQQRGQQGRDRFRTREVRADEYRGVTAFLPDWRGPASPPVEYSVEPTLLFGHGHAVLASTRRGAEVLLEQLARRVRVTVSGDHLQLHGTAMAPLIARNRGILSAARMLDEGEPLDQALRFWRAVETMVARLSLTVTLVPDDQSTELCVTLRGESR